MPFRGRSWLLLLAGVAATSWAAIFVRLADEAPALTIAAYRMLVGAAAVVAIAVLVNKERPAWPGWRRAWPLALSAAFLACHFWTWFLSLERTSVGSSVAIVASQPLLAAFMGFATFRERPSRWDWQGIALASVGLAIIGGRDFATGGEDLAGDGLALLGGAFGAAYRTVGRGMRRSMSTTAYSGSVYVGAAVILWVMVLLQGPQVSGFGAQTWTFLALLGLVPQLIGHTAFNWALAHYRVVTVGLVALGEPVFATLLAIPVLGEQPGAGVLVGGPLILAGVFLGLRGAGEASVGQELAQRQRVRA